MEQCAECGRELPTASKIDHSPADKLLCSLCLAKALKNKKVKMKFSWVRDHFGNLIGQVELIHL